MSRKVSGLEIEIKVGPRVSLLGVQLKATNLQARLLRYQESVRETPGRHLARVREEKTAIDGIFDCLREADEALAKALEFAEELSVEGEGGQGTVS